MATGAEYYMIKCILQWWCYICNRMQQKVTN